MNDRRIVPPAQAHAHEAVEPSRVRSRLALVQDLDVLRVVVAPVLGNEEAQDLEDRLSRYQVLLLIRPQQGLLVVVVGVLIQLLLT